MEDNDIEKNTEATAGEMLDTAKKIVKNGFMKGWAQVRQGEAAVVRSKLMVAIGVTTQEAFRNHLFGRASSEDQASAIEKVFAGHGITNVWGETL